MKKIIYQGLFLTTLGITVVSCKKEAFTNQENDVKVVYASDLKFIINKAPIDTLEFLTKASNNDDEKIDNNLLEISVISRNLLKNGDFNEYLIQKALNRESQCVSLREFIDDKKASASNNQKNIFNNIDNAVKRQDLTHRSENATNAGEIENYIHALFIPNVERADFTKLPIICPGKEVDQNIPGNELYEDYIIGWIKNENGGFTEILLNEEIAMNTTHPIFIIDNAAGGVINRPKGAGNSAYVGPFVPDGDVFPPTINAEFPAIASYEHKINQRFDNTTRSEYFITGIGLAPNTSGGTQVFPSIFTNSNGTTTNTFQIDDIHKDNVGSFIYSWKTLIRSDNGMNLWTPGLKIYYNTYERDWNRSSKPLGQVTYNGETYYLGGRRKYDNDFYSTSPINTPEQMDVPTILSSWAQWITKDNSTVRFWKIQ